MAKETFTINLADDTQISGLELNGTCYISKTKVTADQFTAAGLKTVTIVSSEGTSETRKNMELVDIWKDGSKYWIALREKPADQIYKEQLEEQLTDANNAVAELSELVAALMA